MPNLKALIASLFTLSLLSACGQSLPDTPDSDALVIDVRTQQEWGISRISDAVLIPYDQISSQIASQTTDLEQPIFLYCRSGNRASHAKRDLERLGYTQVFNIGSLRDASEYLQRNIER